MSRRQARAERKVGTPEPDFRRLTPQLPGDAVRLDDGQVLSAEQLTTGALVAFRSATPEPTGSDVGSGLAISRRLTGNRELLPDLLWWRETDGSYRAELRPDDTPGDAVTVSLTIVNKYELYDTVTSYVVQARVPARQQDQDVSTWAEQVLWDFPGTGRCSGDSWYDTTIDDSSDPTLIGFTLRG
ncbi:hypothetical protein EV385_6707 [Krasilnikovia cinnamomea]|uniref:Uncharacterized protein n=1 Tax=Krasilnikovia cinnamomea TaxID=349313 RepID=A0A4Q7Z999_9ACTN|nr:hypothetical protein [Krasilnikovia cinnamomea]RZU46631.1 hypothetical protein EV385_6707 [Krasilnikovia cinnamomea]